MTERENLAGFFPSWKYQLGAEMLAVCSAGECPDARHATQAIRDHADQTIDTGRMIAGRFALDQFLDQGNDVALMLPRVAKKFVHFK